jgi:20S proteasome subunit beta 7
MDALPMDPIKHTQYPIVTGASVIAVSYNGGIILGADTLASYGSMARYKGICRLSPVGSNTVVGGTGEMSDFQQMQQYLDDIVTSGWIHEDGIELKPSEVYNYMGRVLYNRRSKMNPLYNQYVIAGYDDGKPFLGYQDHQGTCYTDKYIATGFGKHMSMPMIRSAYKEDMTEQEARNLVAKCLEVLFYRDCYSSNEVQLAKVDASGVKIDEPVKLETMWDLQKWTKPMDKIMIESGTW